MLPVSGYTVLVPMPTSSSLQVGLDLVPVSAPSCPGTVRVRID